MIPRGTIDIGWGDLLAGWGFCLLPSDCNRVQADLEACWADDALACLSVRTGFDLLLTALALPAGSEILLSAVTIPDMVEIIHYHGLVPVPVDLVPDTLTLDIEHLHRQIRPESKLILVAHVFGSRMPLDHVAVVARDHGLLLIEDCAQAFDGAAYRGHPASDVSMWSFGPIKMQTALGGALLCVRDSVLRAEMRERYVTYRRQDRRVFATRVARYSLLKLLSHPLLFLFLLLICRLLGRDHDRLINGNVRSFAGGNLIERIRHRPSAPLLRLLNRRLHHADSQRIAHRANRLRRVLMDEPMIAHPGANTKQHTYWVMPIQSRNPANLAGVLGAQGFDATRKASSLVVVEAPDGYEAACHAADLLAHLLYLPTSPALSEQAAAHLRRIVIDVEQHQQTTLAKPRLNE